MTPFWIFLLDVVAGTTGTTPTTAAAYHDINDYGDRQRQQQQISREEDQVRIFLHEQLTMSIYNITICVILFVVLSTDDVREITFVQQQ